MSETFDVTVRGAGVVGQALALLLAQQRLRVALVGAPHTATDRQPDIRAYALNRASQRLLAGLRAWPAEATTPVRHMWVADASGAGHGGGVAAHTAFEGRAEEPLSWIADVPALEQRLTEAVSYQSGIQRLGSAQAHTSALSVICEGRRSTSRAAAGITYGVQRYPHTAVAARLRCSMPHGATARQWFQGDGILALLPLGGEQGDTVALVWSLPPEEAQRLRERPAADFAHAVASACGHALGEMETVGTPAAWPLELSIARPWVQPGLALAGDAAHALHPLAGQGLNVGLADVACLARVLQQREYWRPLGDLRLLRRYERERAADVAAMRAVTDGLYGLFAHPDSRVQILRQWGLRNFDRLAPLKAWVSERAMGPAT